ncbi:MAG: MFS transporter [Gammaproteobacteria bacterium]|nr:MFS transporter [Gammaproteobacteria bacterium]
MQPSPPRQRHFVLLLLTLVYAFNFVDRQILGILAPYIQQDLGLDDAQLGLLAGFYFALFYTVIGFPIAWLADRYNRINIVSISLALWSTFTALSGLANNYLQLALARMGVGIGEAGGSPPSHSIISDLYHSGERARALSIYSLGIPFGIMTAYFVSAALLGTETLNWRYVFLALGIPGVLLAIVLRLVVPEPQRGAMDHGAQSSGSSLAESLSALKGIPSYWAMCLGISLASFVAYASSAFLVLYLTRRFPDLPIGSLLIWLGIIHGVGYAGGTYLGGVLADRWGARTRAGYALLPALSLIVALPFFVGAYWVDSAVLALVLMFVFVFLIGFYLGPSFSIAQTLAPVNMRAMSTAIYFFIINMLGLGAGPTVVGFLSDYFGASMGAVAGLRWALTSLVLVEVLAIAAFFVAAYYLPNDWERAASRQLEALKGTDNKN